MQSLCGCSTVVGLDRLDFGSAGPMKTSTMSDIYLVLVKANHLTSGNVEH